MSKILRPYQMSAVRYLRTNSGGALFMKMRLGKTLCTIRYLKMEKNVRHILVVAPYSALDGWRRELVDEHESFSPLYEVHLRKSILDAYFGKQLKWWLLNKESHLYTNYLDDFPWDAIVIDESFIQNPKAKITKYILKQATRIPIRVLLSGTPAPENQLQYYCQLAYLFPGIFGVKNYWEYRARFARPVGFHGWELSKKGIEQLADVLARKCFVLTYEDVKIFEEPVRITRKIRLAHETRKSYLKVERDCLDDLDNILKFAGQRWNLLRRMCTGAEKEKELGYLLRGELHDRKVVLWCNYVEEVEHFAKIYDCPYIHGAVPLPKREQIKNTFEKYVIIQPETQKWGSDFSRADTEIFISTPTSGLTREQAEKRISTPTRTYPDLIVDLIAEDTVEEDIQESLTRKETMQKMVERIRRGILRRHN
jgi:SNF2 family DNA or RNA helicase